MKRDTVRISTIQTDDIIIEIEWKKIKNMHLRVYPPDGAVRITAPYRLDPAKVRMFAESRLEWIRKQQRRINGMKTAATAAFVTGEAIFFCGQRFILEVTERAAKPEVIAEGDTLKLYVRPGSTPAKRRAVIEDFFRSHLRSILPAMIERWEGIMNVKVNEFGIKKMKTKWGTCNRRDRRIWLNLELAGRKTECIEYIVVHELVHLLERGHNDIFYRYMDRFLPDWRLFRKELNSPNRS